MERLWVYHEPSPCGEKAVAAILVPTAPLSVAEGAVKLAVPWLAFALGVGGVGYVLLCLGGVDQPCPAEQLSFAMLEDLEEEHVDGNVLIVEVADNALRGGIEFGGTENNLVRLVQFVLIEFRAEAFLEGIVQCLSARILAVDAADLAWLQLLHPAGVVEGLSNDVAGSLVALEFDQDKGGIRRDGQQVEASTHRRDDLATDQHPLFREDARIVLDHVFKQLLSGESCNGEGSRLVADSPDGVFDRHV